MKRKRIISLACLALATGATLGQSASFLSPEALKAEVQSLKQKQVAWREIQWRTCLLEGLKESREQQKPIMLWIFIDRPIDDERC
jgi:hypothetical protein